MNQNFGSKKFWKNMYKWETRQWLLNAILFSMTVILLSQVGCAYLQAPPRYNNLDGALTGAPNTGRLSAADANEVLSLQERRRAQEFEKNLTTGLVVSASPTLTAGNTNGLPGTIRNLSRWETVNFLIVGPTTKSFILFPGEIKEFSLPVGEYTCRFLRGSYELCSPWKFHVDDKVDYFFGEGVLWGLYYQD